MDSNVYDVIIVGAGIEGSATAYQVAKRGKSSLLLEQFPIPHNRGSSHGQTRITRKAYGIFNHYAVMMEEAYREWFNLEKESNTKLYHETGMLFTGPSENPFVRGSLEFSESSGMSLERLSKGDLDRRYPRMDFPADYLFILDKDAGILMADKGLAAFQSQYMKLGGIIKDNETLINILPGSILLVKTNKRTYKCRSIILTLGPWAAEMLPKLGINIPLKPIRISVCYWKEKNVGDFDVKRFPTFYENNGVDGKYSVYGLPSMEYPGLVKMCLHWGPDILPDSRDNVDEEWVLSKIKKYVADHFPSLHPEPAIVEPCIYTMLPDEDFVLDTHPVWNNVVIGAGFSGHGFKLAPVVGKVLTELALGEVPSYDISKCRLKRFNRDSKL